MECCQVKCQVIPDMNKQQFLTNILRLLKSDRKGIWIGATDVDKEGTWKWVNAENFTFVEFGVSSDGISMGSIVLVDLVRFAITSSSRSSTPMKTTKSVATVHVSTLQLNTDRHQLTTNSVTILTKIVRTGDNVTFDCPIKLQGNNVIEWYGQSNCSIGYATGNSVNPRLSSVAITGDHSNGEYNLMLISVTKFDNGRYCCSLKQNGVYHSQIFSLHVWR